MSPAACCFARRRAPPPLAKFAIEGRSPRLGLIRGCPESNLTAGPNDTSAVITRSTRRATSIPTSGSRSSPITSSTRSRSRDARLWRAATTVVGTVPFACRLPAYFPFESIAAHAASPYVPL
eukprot:2864046-Pleurochrysis_carterae.AAC.1